MCDAFREETGADIAIENPGGIRLPSLAIGSITVGDLLKLDPFHNTAVELTITGEELLRVMQSYARGKRVRLPFVSGVKCEITLNPQDSMLISDIRLLTPDGQPLDLSRSYRVVTNSYISAVCQWLPEEIINNLHVQTSALIIRYLRKKGTVDYNGRRCFYVGH